MSLSEYSKKRRFNKTPEPKGEETEGKEFPIFVIQKHSASSLHFDFRLEHNGVLLSWAVPKGLSTDPSVKRLATKVEDHPFGYKDFEGVIPEGNYGAGGVIVWDRGVYATENGISKDLVKREIEKGLKKGHFAFVLFGEKLKGGFVLAKLNKAKDDWIIFKKKDQYAGKIIKDQRSVLSRRTLDGISGLKRRKRFDLAGPISPMPHNIKPMMAFTAEEAFDKDGWIFELKWDGYRAIAEIDGSRVNLYSRNLISFNEKFRPIVDSLKRLNRKAILDGEIVVVNREGKPDFQILQDYPKTKKGTIVYYVFDLLYIDGHDITSLPLIERKKILKDFLGEGKSRLKYSDHLENEGKKFFNATSRQGIEGIMAKDGASVYKPGVRSPRWLKIKKENTTEAIIAGYTTEGKRFPFSSLILGAYNKSGKLIFIGHVGTGFNDKKSQALIALFQPLTQKKSPFEKISKINFEAVWLKPKLVCTVKFREWTKEKILRQPVFLHLRDDIDPSEVKIESMKKYE